MRIHPWAMRAAVDANCLASLNDSAYWAYVDYVHSHGRDISGAQPDAAKSFVALDNIARTMGTQSKVDQTELAMCLNKQDESLVNQSLKLGNSLGVNGTPQVFVDGERLPSGAPRIWSCGRRLTGRSRHREFNLRRRRRPKQRLPQVRRMGRRDLARSDPRITLQSCPVE